MSDKQPDREKEADAPEGPRNPWVGLITWVVLAPLVYVLSLGPVWWLAEEGYIPEQVLIIYFPLGYLPSGIQDLIKRYAGWWLN